MEAPAPQPVAAPAPAAPASTVPTAPAASGVQAPPPGPAGAVASAPQPEAEASAAAPAAPPRAPRVEVEPDQETYDQVLAEQLAKGTDRRIAEGRAKAAALKAARAKAGEG